MLERIGRLGLTTETKASHVAGMVFLAFAAIKAFFVERGRGRRLLIRVLMNQIYFTAVEPLRVFCFTAVIFGLVVIVAADKILPRYGLNHEVPVVIVVSIVREISPLIIAMILIGRSGTAIATELGNMKLNHELDALSAAGVNLDYYIVLPRMVGVTLATISLMIVFNAVALAGAYGLASLLDDTILDLISVSLLFREIVSALSLETILYALTKAFLFGMTIALANCFYGLNVGMSFTEIPKANVRGVVVSLMLCFIFNAFISIYAIL